MNSKETKPFEKLRSELRQFFKGNKNPPAGHAISKQRDDLFLTADVENEINYSVPIEQRLKTLKLLSEIVLNNKLEEFAIEKLCNCTEDILQGQHPKEHRHTVLMFYQCLVQGQYDRLGVMRTYFFKIIKTHENIEDNIPRLELFQKLTENGKVISSFEEEVGPFLLSWMPVIVANGKSSEFLHILVNYIKYNAAYIDDDIINGIVQNTSYLCCQSDVEAVVNGSLEVLDTIVCYGNISQQTMAIFISALSRTVCLELYNTSSWKIMRNLLGTHMGHFCLQTMCKMLQEENSYSDIGLVSGMIFNLNMALLSNKPDFIIGYTPIFIIPSISKAAHCDDPVILIEVCLCVKCLVEKYGEELKDPLWDRIFSILETLIIKLEKCDQQAHQCQPYIHNIFSRINLLLENNQFKGDCNKLFQLTHRWHSIMPESLIFRLIDYYAKFVIPIEPEWIDKLQSLLTSFFVEETRTSIRIRVFMIFMEILSQNRYHHEKDIINNIVIPFFSNIAYDKDNTVRNTVIKHFLQLSTLCKTSYVESILDILEKVLKLPFESEEFLVRNDDDFIIVVKSVLKGLLDNFILSMHQLPTSKCIRILSIIILFLQNHYKNSHIFESVINIRWMIIDCLLKLRSDSKYRLGYSNEQNVVKYSPYLIVDCRRSSNISLSAVSSVDSKSSTCSSFEEDFVSNEMTYISLSSACQIIITALKLEQDWRILHLILQAIPTALKNKALILSRYTNDVEALIKVLISMISDGYLPDGLKNTPSKFTKPDFYSHVIPVLSAFASYHTHLEFNQQQRLIIYLQHGLVHKSAPQCVTALMTCLLEMKEAMVKLLPDVLLNLSKISATVRVAIPTLEFLSMLTTFPKVFANFTPNQYMSIFAIIFPYTNPFKYDHYTVSLAHHVIAVWFLKCRKPYRQDFIKYIISGLKTNGLSALEEGHFVKNDVLNEDSTNRKRSSSLTEQGNKRKERSLNSRLFPSRQSTEIYDTRKDEKLMFHRELTDTCIDLMSRVAFTSCSPLPKRHPSSDFVLHNGQSMTWLLGNKLITITTSGCTQKPIRNGLCDKCSSYCVIDKDLEYNKSNLSIEETNADIKDNEKQDNDVTTLFQSNYSGNLSQNSIYSSNSVNSSMNSGLNISSGAEEKKINENLDINNHYNDEIGTQDQCICWCQGWAEIHIRRPTGDISWIMRIQNETNSFANSDPMIDMSTLFQSSIIQHGIKMQDSNSRVNTDNNSIEGENTVNSSSILLNEFITNADFDSGTQFSSDVKETLQSSTTEKDNYKSETQSETIPMHFNTKCDGENEINVSPEETLNDQYNSHGRNPVRRSNSSPEMSSNWKNTYLKDPSHSINSSPVNEFEQNSSNETSCSAVEGKKPGKGYVKEIRGNCEAIPEEFSGQGTTPPKTGIMNISTIPNNGLNVAVSLASNTLSDNEKYSCTKSTVSNILPSFSYEDINPKSEEKKMENKFFDKQSLPNDHFEFNRSASVSQVVPSLKKLPPISTGPNLSQSLTSSQPHLTTKPPLSPPTYPSRFVNRHLKDPVPMESRSDSSSQLNQEYKRYRFNTISVMSSIKKPQSECEPSKNRSFRITEPKKSGLNPSFVFLQLYDSSQCFDSLERPLLVPSTAVIQRAINIFDLIPPYETHKVGVIYVGPAQANNETEILRNSHGSIRYAEFLSKLGTLVNLTEVNPQNIFLGGLEQNGNDGKFAYIWKDDVMQVIFHVATLMPNKESDLNCNNKKKHIGNDYVTIVYNESEKEYDLHTVKCQFNFACVIIEPLDHGSNQLTVKARDDLKKLIDHEKKIVSDKNVSLLARQLALHINLASLILCSLNKDKNYGGIYASNWLERLRKIKHIKNKVYDELNISTNTNENRSKQGGSRNSMFDFTDYTS